MRIDEIANSKRTETVKISKKEIDTFLKTKCPIAYNSPVKIYRGVDTTKKFMFGDSRLSERQSNNTANYYTLLIDNILPEWKDYPKRSKSFICTNNEEYTTIFGELYQVFPVGDPLIGICPVHDIWMSFIPEINTLPLFCDFLDILANKFNLDLNDSINSLTDFIIEMNKIFVKSPLNLIKIINDIKVTGYREPAIQLENNNYHSFLDILEHIFNPTIHNFKLENLSMLNMDLKRHELWFSGPAYFLNVENEVIH